MKTYLVNGFAVVRIPQIQKFHKFKKYTLLELELPRLLASDLPSNWPSIRDLNCSHSNCKA